jgi:hypothetical protein
MKKIIKIISVSVFLIYIFSSFAFGMAGDKAKGVVIFFKEDKIVLKTNNTRLEDICDAVENLTGIRIIVDDILLNKSVSVDIGRKRVEDLLIKIVEEVPFARFIKILKSEEQKELLYFIIFKKSKDSKEIDNEFYDKKDGLQKAFLAKYNGLGMSGRLSISGTFKLSGAMPYKLPMEIKRFAEDFMESNNVLLNISDITLKVKRIKDNFIDYKQYYKGVLIDNLRSYALQVKYVEKEDGLHIIVSNNTIPKINISVQPKITEEEAVKLVVNEIRRLEKNSMLYAKEDVIPESIELKILPQLEIETDKIIEKFKTMSLYWSVNIDFYNFFVDAKTGKVYKAKYL